MGKGGEAPPEEGKLPEAAAAEPTLDGDVANAATTSPTKTSKLEMFSNVKTQIGGIGGWIGSNMPAMPAMPSIPKLRKGEGDAPPTDEAAPPAEGDALVDAAAAAPPTKDDDDNSRLFSATGGADSGPGTPPESPTEEAKDGQFGNVQSKALAGAKSFGSFLYSAASKAGAKVSEAGAKVKEAVEKNTILGEFNKEQEAFAAKQAENAANSLPPWTGCTNEEALKEECLSLSTDKRNFVRSPPAGVDFHFDYDVSYPVAMTIMEQDPNLEKMRYELVPKIITEENFWRNYFYRVSLICQANELSFMSREGDSQSGETTSDQPLDTKTNEFISDTMKVSTQDLAEVQEGMRKLALGSKTGEEEWEKELEAELQDYEVVSEHKSSSSKNDNWEQDMDDILDDEEDLK